MNTKFHESVVVIDDLSMLVLGELDPPLCSLTKTAMVYP